MTDMGFGKRLVKVSGIGQDRPGIVHRIASVVKQHAGNIVFQRSMTVAGEFAITLVASFEDGDDSTRQGVINTLKGDVLGDNFIIFAREVQPSAFAQAPIGGATYLVKAEGDDRMGIVESITLLLLRHNLNLDAMECEVSYRPLQGTRTFTSTFTFTAPEDFAADGFADALKQFEADADLKIELSQK